MNFQNKKLELIQWLSSLNDAIIIDKIAALREQESGDWWENLSKDEKESIEKGIDDADNGRLNPHSKAKKIYGKWL